MCFYSLYLVQETFYNKSLPGPVVMGSISVIPHQKYVLSVEIMNVDTDNTGEYATIVVDGVDIGTCDPKGDLCSCTWHDCTENQNNQNVPRHEIISSTGIIQVTASFSAAVNQVCNCNWKGVTSDGFIRVTMIPR